MILAGKFCNVICNPSRNNAVSPEIKLLLTLRFYAGGLMLQDAGDLVGVSKTTACNIVRDVSHEIALLSPQFIKMPTGDSIRSAREMFYERARFPRVIGSLDCTHIRIQSPGTLTYLTMFFLIPVVEIIVQKYIICNVFCRWKLP